jgi:hypothetical protein
MLFKSECYVVPFLDFKLKMLRVEFEYLFLKVARGFGEMASQGPYF